MFKVSHLRNVDYFRIAAYLTAGEINVQAPRLLLIGNREEPEIKKRVTVVKKGS